MLEGEAPHPGWVTAHSGRSFLLRAPIYVLPNLFPFERSRRGEVVRTGWVARVTRKSTEERTKEGRVLSGVRLIQYFTVTSLPPRQELAAKRFLTFDSDNMNASLNRQTE